MTKKTTASSAKKKTAPKKSTKKGKGSKKKEKCGPKTKYKPEYPEQARKLCLLGYRDIDMAEFFGVAESTFHAWKLIHPELVVALKKGKEVADCEIAASLFERAKGYSHPDTHITNYQGVVTKTKITKYYPPDTGAAFIWLKNRQPKIWRDKQEIEVSGETTQVNIYELPDNGRTPDAEPEADETD